MAINISGGDIAYMRSIGYKIVPRPKSTSSTPPGTVWMEYDPSLPSNPPPPSNNPASAWIPTTTPTSTPPTTSSSNVPTTTPSSLATMTSTNNLPQQPANQQPTQPSGFGVSSYTGPSIVDYLKSVGKASDFTSRSALAQQMGISGYSGTAEQNTRLLGMLRGQAPASVAPPMVNVPTVSTPSNFTSDTATIPDWLKNNSDFQRLPKDMQDYLVQYYAILQIQDTETQKKLNDALAQAQIQANPYWAEVIRMAQDELTRAIGAEEADFVTKQKDLQIKINQIKEDLATKKKDLTIDEQAELARQARAYQNDLDTLRESAAGAGLTFSTKREQAESKLATQNLDIVESTKRQYMRQARDLETAAARVETEALAKIDEYQRILGESEFNLIRSAESKLGTANLPSLPGITTGASSLGGISGSIGEQKTKDIWTRAEALAGLGNPFLP